jgi:putative FmdB family regulatory protein
VVQARPAKLKRQPLALDIRLSLTAGAQGVGSALRRCEMPVYEYVCRDCQKPFEVIRPMAESTATPKCPACGSTRVERTYSHVYAQTSKKS